MQAWPVSNASRYKKHSSATFLHLKCVCCLIRNIILTTNPHMSVYFNLSLYPGTIYTSPLLRAAETARIVAQACGPAAQLRFDETFLEMDTGLFSGLGYDEAQERYPDIFAVFQGRSWEAVPGAEKAEALYARAMRAWSLLRERALSGEKALACTSHSGFIQWLVRATFGCRAWMPLFSIANCGVFELIVAPTRSGLAYLQWRNLNLQAPSAATGFAIPKSVRVDQSDPFQVPG